MNTIVGQVHLSGSTLATLLSRMQFLEERGKADVFLILPTANDPYYRFELTYKPGNARDELDEEEVDYIFEHLHTWSRVDEITHYLQAHKIEVITKIP